MAVCSRTACCPRLSSCKAWSFAYAGIELIGTAAGEAQDAKKILPRAINSVMWRIALFYVGSVVLNIASLGIISSWGFIVICQMVLCRAINRGEAADVSFKMPFAPRLWAAAFVRPPPLIVFTISVPSVIEGHL